MGLASGFDISLLRFDTGFDLARAASVANRAWPDLLFALGTDLSEDAGRSEFDIKGYDVFK